MPMLVRTEADADVARKVSFEDTPLTNNATQSQQPSHPSGTDFQLAGVTLDAGVKIYCSRVDSVHVNAFKVLGGLSQANPRVADGDGGNPSDDVSADPQSTRTRSGHPGRATLESNLQTITSQKLETDLVVDPLFQKMSAAFDEGGASGMLINNLSVSPAGQVIFDSAESSATLMHTGGNEGDDLADDEVYTLSDLGPPPDDRNKICPNFLRFFRAKMAHETSGASSQSTYVNSSSETQLPTTQESSSSWQTETSQVHFEYDETDADQGELGVYIGAESTNVDNAPQQEHDDDINVFPSRMSLESTASVSMAAQRGKLDLVEAGMELREDDDYAFFSQATLDAWAGPAHWRFRAAEAFAAKPADRPKKVRGKTAMLLEFSSEAAAVNFEKEFEPGKTATSNQLSVAMRKAMDEKKVTLPEDLHMSARWLTGLFLKKGVHVNILGKAAEDPATDEQPAGGSEWYDFDNDCDNEGFGGDFADGEAAEDTGMEGHGDGDIESLGVDLITEPKRVAEIDIQYAKVAKDVDVRALKTGLWAQLCGETGGTKDECSEEVSANEDVRKGATQSLQHVVQNMDQFVAAPSLPDVSLSYVFICLLHLANEKELRIESPKDGNEVMCDLNISVDG